MPELPEVETIRLNLEQHIINRTILDVDVHDVRLRWPVQPQDFEKWINGQAIIKLSRRSKYLIFHLDNKAAIIIHLGMSGRLGMFSGNDSMEKHTHVVFCLDNGLEIRYRDPRRFGLVEVTAPDTLSVYPRFSHLGVEPLSKKFDAAYVSSKSERSKKAIKLWIMDAQNVVGVGNIYASEALFNARIHPERPANSLTSDEQHNLASSIKLILSTAIEHGGTTLSDFRNAHGEPGYFQQELAVYQKAGDFCKTCGAEIQKIVLSGRSTFFCPACQK